MNLLSVSINTSKLENSIVNVQEELKANCKKIQQMQELFKILQSNMQNRYANIQKQYQIFHDTLNENKHNILNYQNEFRQSCAKLQASHEFIRIQVMQNYPKNIDKQFSQYLAKIETMIDEKAETIVPRIEFEEIIQRLDAQMKNLQFIKSEKNAEEISDEILISVNNNTGDRTSINRNPNRKLSRFSKQLENNKVKNDKKSTQKLLQYSSSKMSSANQSFQSFAKSSSKSNLKSNANLTVQKQSVGKNDKKNYLKTQRSSIDHCGNEIKQEQSNEVLSQVKRLQIYHNRLQTLIMQSIQEMNNKIKTINFDKQLNNDKFASLMRRLDRESYKVNELKTLFKHLEETRLDEKVINKLEQKVNKNISQMQFLLQKKISRQQYVEQIKPINEKISILQKQIFEKSDKIQVKNALYFLENKIKEIVFVICSDQKEYQATALKTSQYKCLSCEKGIVANNQENGATFRRAHTSQRPSTRCQSGYLRKKIRIMNMSQHQYEIDK